MDAIDLTHSYPYEEINDYLRHYPDRRPAVRETVAYFDSLNFADHITCPMLVNIGLQDDVCPPETGYALFNRLGAIDKRLYPYEGPSPRCRALPAQRHCGPVFRAASSAREVTAWTASPQISINTGSARSTDLAGIPARPELELLPLRTTDFATLYSVCLTSLGPYRLFGYLSIPVGTGPFPRDLLCAQVSKCVGDHSPGHGQYAAQRLYHVRLGRARATQLRHALCRNVSRASHRAYRTHRILHLQGAGGR